MKTLKCLITVGCILVFDGYKSYFKKSNDDDDDNNNNNNVRSVDDKCKL
jgi:hypothetical protein